MIRRAKPLLGTIVSIAAEAGTDAAFAAIERVHVLMSAQRAESDICRINREAHRRPIRVHPWTLQVLEMAHRVSECSSGAFDIVVPGSGARFSDVVLEDGAVRLRRAAQLDVSGIAKGFAVDLAVDALQHHGARSGSVNAGGDLRFFGEGQAPVRIRVPGGAGHTVQLPALTHRAYATSSGEFGARLHDPRSGAPMVLEWSVTIAAATCVMADALTKVVALLGPLPALLKTFDAGAYAVDREGRLLASAG